MSCTVKINITQNPEELKKLLSKQKTAMGKERVQALYLLSAGEVETVQHLAVILGRDRRTVQRWLREYREGGLDKMLTLRKSPGRTSSIPQEALEKLRLELQEPEGFSSYGEVQKWLRSIVGVEARMKKLGLVEAMNIEALKLELIQWILLLQDTQLLNEIQNIKENSGENSTAIQPRKFGCGKGIFTYVADDFDATPAGFEEYMLP